MHRTLLLHLALVLALSLLGCPSTPDDDDTTDDDDVTSDDDDTAPDDDDTGPDDDDTGPDDDDTGPDDDDTGPDDDDTGPDDDDATGDDDDATGDDDDATGDDDDDATGDDDDATGDDDDDATVDPCIQDGFEPNDAQANASLVSPGTIVDLHACPTDDDWFAVGLTAGAQVDFAATFTHPEGNIDLELYNESGALLADSLSASDGEAVGYTASLQESVFLRVTLAADLGGQVGNPYTLDISATGLGCVTDPFEPNDAYAQAQALGAGQTGTLTACGDDDWYSVALNGGETLELDALFAHNEGNIDVHFADSAGNVFDSASSFTDNEALTFTAPTTQTVLIQVVLTSDLGLTPGNPYVLDVSLGLASCAPDSEEPNDDAGSASSLALGSTTGLSACPSDDDWYAFSAGAGQQVDINAFFDHNEGNINMTLRDAFGGVLASAASANNDESITYTPSAPVDLLLQVDLFSDSGLLPGNPYELNLALSAATCASDTFEPNDSLGGAAVVTATDYTGLSACEDDDDWFRVSLLNGEDVAFDVAFSAIEGNIDIELYDASSSLLASSTGTGELEDVSWTATADEDVYLRVFLTTDSGSLPGTAYTLTVTGVPPSCLPDAFEPNEASTSPAAIGTGNYNNLSICTADSDWYAIDLLAGDIVTVNLLFDHDEGDLGLQAFDASVTSLVSSFSSDDNEDVTFSVSSDGPALLQVTLDQELGSVPGNSYSLDVAIVSLSCPTDSYEPNDNAASPAPIAPGTYTGLSACDSDADYYAIDLAGGDLLDVSALFSHAGGDIDLALLDVAGTVLTDSSTTDDNEALSYTAPTTDTYLVRVELVSDIGDPGNGYTLLLSTGASVCEPDDFEPNDDFGSAAPITPDVYNSLTACGADEDWYLLSLPVGSVLDVDVSFAQAEGDIDIYLLDDNLTELDSGLTINDNESVSHVAAYSGSYFVQVILAADAGALPGNPYALSVSAPPVPCPFDVAEPNDDFSEAAQLSPDGLTELAVCPTEDDWFLVVPTAGDVITFDVLFGHAEGDIDVTLYDSALGVLASATSSDDNEQLSYTATDSSALLLEVALVLDTGLMDGNPYSIEVIGLSEVCFPDTYESDNDATGATAVVDEDTVTGLTACPTDVDWFAIDLLAGDVIDVAATFDNDEGDIDINLYSPSEIYLTAATSTDDDEVLNYTTNDTGTHYVEAVLVSDMGVVPGNSYAISFDVVSTICVADGFEPNENQQDAAALAAGSYTGLTSCSEPDWYSIDVGNAETLSVAALFEHAEGDIDIALYDDGGSLLEVGASADDDESLILNSTAAGTYFIEVVLTTDLGSDAGNTYDLDLAVATINCTADAFEPNDAQGSPVTLGTGQTPDLVSCPTDFDWFNFGAAPGDVIDILALFDGADGDLDLELYDPTGALVDAATSSTSNEQIVHSATETGQYVLGVQFMTEGSPPDGVAYVLNLSVGSESCFFDWGEPNDDFTEPTLLGLGEHPHLLVCDTDEDWFAIELADDQTLELEATFSHAEGDIDLLLYDPTMTFVDQAISTSDNETISYQAPPATGGLHVLQVILAVDSGPVTGNPYSLDVAYSDLSGCPVDEHEDNDDAPTAGFIALGAYPNQSVCETDEDWFGIALGAGDTLNVDLVFAHADGDIDVMLYDTTFSVVDAGTTTTDNESVSYTAPSAGGAVIQITMPGDDVAGGGNTYDMVISGNTSTCTPDLFEEDDSSGAAAPLPLGTTLGLRACPSDDDWSLVLLDVGQTATWTATFAHAEGDIDLELFDFAGNSLDSSTSVSDNEAVSYTATVFGYYYVKTSLVSDAGDPGNGYSMGLSVN